MSIQRLHPPAETATKTQDTITRIPMEGIVPLLVLVISIGQTVPRVEPGFHWVLGIQMETLPYLYHPEKPCQFLAARLRISLPDLRGMSGQTEHYAQNQMRTQQNILVSIIIATSIGSFGDFSSVNADDFLTTTIQELTFKNESLDSALATLSKKAREAGAEKIGYRGLIYSETELPSSNLTLELNNVSFGYSLSMICEVNSLEFYIKNNMVIIQKKLTKTYETIILTPRLLDALGVIGPVTPEGIRNGLLGLTLRIENHDKIVVPESSEFAVIEISQAESNSLQVIVDLINRGLKVKPD